MTTRFRTAGRAVAITVTTGVALSLAGCGDGAASGPGIADPDNTIKVDQGGALSKDQIMSAAYLSSVKAGSAHMTMTMTATGQQATTMKGDVSYAGGRSTMKATMTMPQMGPGTMEMRYVGNVVYMQIPGVTPAGKFLAIDPKDQSSPMAKSFAGLSEQMDPMASLKKMQAAVISADRVGRGTLQGVAVDHYKVVVDTAKAIGNLGAAAQAAQSQLPKTLTYEMWLDAKNLLRRMVFDVAGTSIDVEMSKWGKPVQVTRPAARDLVKAPSAPSA